MGWNRQEYAEIGWNRLKIGQNRLEIDFQALVCPDRALFCIKLGLDVCCQWRSDVKWLIFEAYLKKKNILRV